MDQYLIQLIDDLASGSPERNNAAANELTNFFLKPENFPFLLEILKLNVNDYARQFILVTMNHVIPLFYHFFDEQIVNSIIEILTQIILYNSNFMSRFHSCKVISTLCNKQLFKNLDSQIDILQHHKNLEEFIFIILEDSYCTLNNPSNYNHFLIQIFKEFATSQNLEYHRISTSFFSNFIANIDEPLELDDPELFDVICKSLFLAIQQNSEDDSKYFTKVISTFLEQSIEIYEFIPKYSNSFFEIAFNCINNNLIPINIRIIVHQIFKKMEYISTDQIMQIIPISINMTCEICSNDSLDDQIDYKFNYEFFTNVLEMDNFRDSIDTFNFFYSIIQNLLETNAPPTIQTAIYLLDILIDENLRFVPLHKESIIQIIQNSFQISNQQIIDVTFQLINNLMSQIPYILRQIYNDIVRFFLSHQPNHYQFVFSAFSIFLNYLPELPADLGEIISLCMSTFQDQNPEIRYYSIECLKNAIRFYRPDKACEFPLDLMIKDQENISVIYDLLGNLIKVYPASLRSFIPSILQSISQSLQENYLELDASLCLLLRKLIKYFPNTMSGFIGQIQEIIGIVYNFVYVDSKIDWENYIQRDSALNARSQFLLLISLMYKSYDLNLEMFMNIIKEETSSATDDVDPSINSAIRLIANKIDTGIFLTYSSIDSFTKSKLIKLKGVGESFEEINVFIMQQFGNEFDEFDNNVFILINTLLSCGIQLPDAIAEIQKRVDVEDFDHQAWAILSMTRIAQMSNDGGAIMTMLQTIMKYINTVDFNQKTLLLKALNVILMNNTLGIQIPNEVALMANEFLNSPFATPELKNESILALILLNPQMNLNDARNLLNLLSLKMSSDETYLNNLDLINHISLIVSQLFMKNNAAFNDEMIKIALFVMSSEPHIWLQIKPEVRNLMKQFVAAFPEDFLVSYLRNNERKINLVKSNMSI